MNNKTTIISPPEDPFQSHIDFSLYINSQTIQFNCEKCYRRLFTNDVLVGVIFTNSKKTLLIIDPNLGFIDLKLMKETIENEDQEFKEDDSIFHPSCCGNCAQLNSKFIFAASLHKKSLQNKIVVDLSFIRAELIINIEDGFTDNLEINFLNILASFNLTPQVSDEAQNKISKLDKVIVNIYQYLKKELNMILFKHDIESMKNDFSTLSQMADLMENHRKYLDQHQI